MSPDSIALIERVTSALSVRSLQHEVMAANIANRDTQGYQRMKLRFDSALGTAPRIVADLRATPPAVEAELQAMAANSMEYQAMAAALGRYFAILSALSAPGAN